MLQGAPVCTCAFRLTLTLAPQPYHAGVLVPETPARLLRTRFSAYCKGKADYIIDTTHPDNEQLRSVSRESFAADVVATADKGRFSALEVLAESPGVAPDQAIVAFRYIVRPSDRCVCSHALTGVCVQFEIVGQKGFGARPSSRQQVTETSVFMRDAASAPWRFHSSQLKADKLTR